MARRMKGPGIVGLNVKTYNLGESLGINWASMRVPRPSAGLGSNWVNQG